MITRCVKWNKDSAEFIESAANNSLDLTFVVSHSCESQSGEGFEELVNTVTKIREKVRSFRIIDASYLYRHCIPGFSQLSDKSIPSIWFSNNKKTIAKIPFDVEFIHWVDHINTEEFQKWNEKITRDFYGDENGNHVDPEFQKLLVEEANIFVSKDKGSFDDCLKFCLEEYAHTCAFLKDAIIIYPVPFSSAMNYVIDHHNLNIRGLHYGLSNYTRAHQRSRLYDHNKINQEVVSLLKTEVLKINFFAIDKYGKYIFKNDTLSEIVKDTPFVSDPKAWESSIRIMETGQREIVEEQTSGESYLSVKAPLVLDGEVEGVIGIAIDITDRKKAEELQIKNKEQEVRIEEQKEFGNFTAQVLHDIASPISSLELIIKSPDIPQKYNVILKNIINSVKNIFGSLVSKYREYEQKTNPVPQNGILLSLELEGIVQNKKYEYLGNKIEFNYSFDPDNSFVFIEGNQMCFGRMISNLINNAVEACNKSLGVIDVSFNIDGKSVKITVSDNGVGIPQEVIAKINSRSQNFDSTKHAGACYGLNQILTTVDLFKGMLTVESKKNGGTTFSITFPQSDTPSILTRQLTFKKGDVVVVLDDDHAIFDIIAELTKEHSKNLTLKYFTDSRAAINFIDSFYDSDKIFLLSAYDLRGSDFNGLTVILQSGLPKNRTCILTNSYGDSNLRDMAHRSNVKILLKQFLMSTNIEVI